MSELHEAVFRWPHPEANDVVVTGTFDQWRASIHLPKQGASFEGKVQVPWGEKVTYKYIVDGHWTTTDDQPTEYDSQGNLNNVYTAPARPPAPKEEVPAPEPVEVVQPKEEPEANGTITDSAVGVVSNVVGVVTDAAKSMVEAIAPGTVVTPSTVADSVGTEAPAEEVPEVEQAKSETVAEPTATEVPPPSAEVSEEPSATTKELPAVPAGGAPDLSPASEVSREELLVSESSELAPIVPLPILPLISEAESGAAPEVPPALPEVEVTAEKPLDTTVVEGTTTAETAVGPAPVPAEEISTHEPATNGATTAAPTNGVHTNGANGASHAPTPAAPVPISASSASSPSSTMKRMRFPSIASRRSSMHSASTNEFGEVNGKHDAGSLKRSERHKKNSIFGKLKGIFHHDSAPQKN